MLALYAAVYPALLASVGVLLASPRRLQLLTVFLTAGMTVSVVAGVVIVTSCIARAPSPHPARAGAGGRIVAVGVFALLLGLAIATHARQRAKDRRAAQASPWRGPAEPARRKSPGRSGCSAEARVPIVVLAAVILNLPGAVYLVALKDIAAARDSFAVEVLEVITFNLIMFALAEIPLIGLILAPERTDRLVHRALDFLGLHGSKIATGLCVIVGLHLIVRGAVPRLTRLRTFYGRAPGTPPPPAGGADPDATRALCPATASGRRARRPPRHPPERPRPSAAGSRRPSRGRLAALSARSRWTRV